MVAVLTRLSVIGLAAASLLNCQSRTARNQVSAAELEGKTVPEKAKAIMANYCTPCHNATEVEAGFGLADNFDALRVSQFVKPFRLEESNIWQRAVKNKDMPPSDADKIPSDAERKILEQWILEGAKGVDNFKRRDFISTPKLLSLIRSDLLTLSPDVRKNTRYLTLHKFQNARQQNPDGSTTYLFTDDLIDVYRKGMNKVLNHLSWQPEIALPIEVPGSQGTIFRVNLDDYRRNLRLSGQVQELGISAAAWEELAGAKLNPYFIRHNNSVATEIYNMTGSEAPYTRLDFFVFLATKPPLYHQMMGIAQSLTDIETLLGFDRLDNIENYNIMRSGFVNSGVSQHNRLIERHTIRNPNLGYKSEGYYWISYDFAGNILRQNLQNFPAGPNQVRSFGDQAFDHDGGEVIFSLPNGMQAYVITNDKDIRIDRAPTAVVSEPRQPEGVFNGISCMSCHVEGIKPKDDQMRTYVQNAVDQVRDAFPAAIQKFVYATYVEKRQQDDIFARDQKRWYAAMEEAKSNSGEEPIAALYYHFEKTEVGLSLAAAETDLTPDQFMERLTKSNLKSVFSSFYSPGGTVKRQTFKDNFVNIIREFKLALNDNDIANAKHVFKTNSFVDPKRAIFWKHTFEDQEIGLFFTNVLFHGPYKQALDQCKKLNGQGENAWGVPTSDEMRSIINNSLTDVAPKDFFVMGTKETGFWSIGPGGKGEVVDSKSSTASVQALETAAKFFVCVRDR